MSHCAENCRRGTLQSFIDFGYRKSLDERVGRWGQYQDLPSKNFCLTMPESFVGQPFRVSLISDIENFYASEFMSLFSVEVFCLTVLKILVDDSFIVSLISGIEKTWMRGWGGGSIKILRRKFLSHSAKNFVGQPF